MDIAPELGEQREQVLKALAITEVCKHALVSKLDGLDPDTVADALGAIADLLNDVAAELQTIRDDHGNHRRVAIKAKTKRQQAGA